MPGEGTQAKPQDALNRLSFSCLQADLKQALGFLFAPCLFALLDY
jgi:hypothetical protein